MRLYQLSHNANVVHLDSAYILFSYNENVGLYTDEDILYLKRGWDKFSVTTNRHVYKFISTYTTYKVSSKKEVDNLIAQNKIKLVDSF